METREEYPVLPSTQDRAISLARQGAVAGTRIVAHRQTAGRGRAAHAWYSPDGGLYLSIVLPAGNGADVVLPLALGAAICATFEHKYGLKSWIRWPNDVVVVDSEGRAAKLAGVIVDRVARQDGSMCAVAGFGVNVDDVHGSLPEDLRVRATSLAQWVRPPPPLRVVEDDVSMAALDVAQQLGTRARGDDPLRQARARLLGVGRTGYIDGRAAGRIQGLGEDGSLIMAGENGPIRVIEGELRIEEV